ncbi:MAG TPA: hypothetical protein VH373_22140 [Jatrophihabitantaceae bacterium]
MPITKHFERLSGVLERAGVVVLPFEYVPDALPDLGLAAGVTVAVVAPA